MHVTFAMELEGARAPGEYTETGIAACLCASLDSPKHCN